MEKGEGTYAHNSRGRLFHTFHALSKDSVSFERTASERIGRESGMLWVGLALVIASIVLFRRAAFVGLFPVQAVWVLGAAGTGLAGLWIAKGFGWGMAFLIVVGLFLWDVLAKEPDRGRFYQKPIYLGGLWGLLILNWFARRGEIQGMLIVSALCFLGYLTFKTAIRSYE